MGNCFCKSKCIICSYVLNNNEELITMSICCGQVLHKSCFHYYNKRHNMCPKYKYTVVNAPKYKESVYL